MQGLFFVFGNSCYEQADGVANKIKAQIDVFNRAKLNCKEFVFPNKKDLFYVFKWRLPFFNVSPKWFYDEIFSDIDYIYSIDSDKCKHCFECINHYPGGCYMRRVLLPRGKGYSNNE